MCGLVGIAGKLEAKDEKTLQRLLVFDYFRGPDSTGFAAVRNTGEMKVSKVCSHPLDLFEMQSFKNALSGYNSTVFIGHNRAATKGVVNSFNAHPFVVDNIVGAHNGTLMDSSHKALEEKLGERYSVDSLAIITAISRFGIEEVIPLLQGAWALTWYNRDDNTFNFIRNKDRPFWYAYTKKFDRLFWASEHPILDAAIRNSTIEYEMYEEGEEKFRYFSTAEDVWYSYDVDELKAGSDYRPKPKEKILKGKEVVVASSGQDPFHRSGTTPNGKRDTQTGRSTRTSTTTSRSDALNWEGTETNPYCNLVSKERFAELAKTGCDWCSKEIVWGDVVTICENADLIRCSECSIGDSETSRIYVTNFKALQ